MNKKGLIYFIFSFLLALNVASLEDFAVTAQDKVDLCPCSNQGYVVYVQNKGSLTTTYSISFSGSAAEWVKASPSKFKVNPGVASYFFIYVSSDCNIKGAYDLNIHVKTSSLTKIIKQNFNFIECYKFDIELGNLIEAEEGQTSASFSEHIGDYNACEKEKIALPILITNKESYANIYLLSLRGGPDWAKLNTDKVSLGGNQRGIVLIELSPGEGAEKNYKLEFEATTELGNVKKSEEISINVDKCYGLEIDLEKEEGLVCGETPYDMKIHNSGKLRENINLSTNFDWAIINETSSLGGDEEVISSLILIPENISGVFDVEVKGSVLNKDIEASDKIRINVVPKEECYKTEIELKEKITNHYTEEYYNVRVINKGLKKAFYDVSLESSPSWVTISPDFLELNPGQKGNLNLYVNPDENVESGAYKLILNLNFNNVSYAKEANIKLAEENKIIKNIKDFVRYFQFYIYLGLVMLVLIFLLIKPIKKRLNRIKESYGKHKLKKERKKQLEEERERKREEKRKLEEEKKAGEEKEKKEKEEKRKKLAEEKKVESKKKAEKSAGKKKRKISEYLPWFIVLFALIIVGVLIFLGVYFEWLDLSALYQEIDFNVFPYITDSLEGIWAYSYYIFIALVFLALIILFFHNLEKKGKKKSRAMEKEQKEKKKSEKKKIKFSKFFKPFFKVSLIILILLAISFAVYYFFDYVKEFFVLYLYYIIIGIILLILIVLFMRFYKPIADFFTKGK